MAREGRRQGIFGILLLTSACGASRRQFLLRWDSCSDIFVDHAVATKSRSPRTASLRYGESVVCGGRSQRGRGFAIRRVSFISETHRVEARFLPAIRARV